MSEIILFHFEQSQIRFVGTADRPEWVAADICKVLDLPNVSQAIDALDEDEKDICKVDTLGGEQEMLTVNEFGVYRLIFKSKKPAAKKLKRWIAHDVLPSIRATGSYSVSVADRSSHKEDREKLERKFALTPEIKQMKAMYGINKMMHGKAYADRWMLQMQQRHYPALVGDAPKPEELASLPTVKALLTPTQIAEHLSLFYPCGNKVGDARRINKLLMQLGYQEKIADRWSATQKATDLNLCDRKPVNTNSRTQKDQLLWSSDISSILSEHILHGNTINFA